MFVSDSIGINKFGHLTIGDADTLELASRYGTPLYVFDETQIRSNCRAYVKSIDDEYDGKGLVLYASKAFCCLEMCRICAQEKLGLDVVSAGELFTAVKAGFPMEKVVFHGNNKTPAELTFALSSNVGRIVADNMTELELIDELSLRMNKKARVILRIKPGIDAHTHKFIATGQIDSKFGFALETGEAMQAVKKALSCENIELTGLHCHIGSQILDVSPFEKAAQVMAEFISDIKKETGYECSELDLGGGFGIKYESSDDPVPYGDYMKIVSKALHESCSKLGTELPFIMIEPGRSIAGSAGLTLYTVGSVKEIPGVRTYVSVDGGMTDNPRYILYQSRYEMMIANKAADSKDAIVTVAGKCCESGDLLGENVPLQKCGPGDILAVLSTGAYNYSMASNYNRIPRPAAVMVRNGADRVIIQRETFEDIIGNDV